MPEPETDTGELERRRHHARELAEPSELEEPSSEISGEISDEDIIKTSRKGLRGHMGIDGEPAETTNIMFFVELAPCSSQEGAVCQLDVCKEMIEEGGCRIAVYPGPYKADRSADLYHVHCFEKLADFSSLDYLLRLQLVTRMIYTLRELKDELSERDKELKRGLGEKAARAIRRLSKIPMADLNRQFIDRTQG